MSSVYATEPAVSGRVVLETTHGPLDIELWCRECPTATRFFLQLVQDGFYAGVIFHRTVPSTLIQCGAVRRRHEKTTFSATGNSPKEWQDYRVQYGGTHAVERQRYELNSRLRFRHRGLVALALPVESTDNKKDPKDNNDDNDEASMQPQFFITLTETPYLDGKHVIIGRLTPATVFHAVRMGQLEVADEAALAQEAPCITHAKIVDASIHNTALVPCPQVPWRQEAMEEESAKTTKRQKKKRKGKLDVNVLSFGDEFPEEEQPNDDLAAKRIKSSSHNNADGQDAEKPRDKRDKKKDKERNKVVPRAAPEPEETNLRINRLQEGDEIEQPRKPEQQHQQTQRTSAQEKETKESKSKREEETTTATKTNKTKKKKPKLSGASLLEAMRSGSQFSSATVNNRGSKKSTKRSAKDDDNALLSKLSAFQGRLGGDNKSTHNDSNPADEPLDNSLAARMARRAKQAEPAAATANETVGYHGQVLEDNQRQAHASWMSTEFTCRKHMDQAAQGLAADGRNTLDEYEVVDERRPRQGTSSDKHKHSRGRRARR